MVEQYDADTNPNLIDVYLQALLQRESTGNYQAKHASSIITDFATKKPIKVQALGGYGILDVNFPVWAKQAGLQDFSMSDGDWKDPKVQDAIAKYKVQEQEAKTDTAEVAGVYAHSQTIQSKASKWSVTLSSTVRPVVTYMIIILWLSVKLLAVVQLYMDGGELYKVIDNIN